MQIRTMTPEDYDRVRSLWMSCRNMGFNNLDDSREGIGTYLKRNPDTSFVCEDGGRIIGVVLAGHDGRRGLIYHTCVAEDRRGEKIASRLVEKYGIPMERALTDAAAIAETWKEQGVLAD